MSSRKTCKYDVMKIIQLIKSKHCIWDKECDDYANKVEKRLAWIDIFQQLEPNYSSMSELQRNGVGEIIMTKWQNLRDAYSRSLRLGLSKPYRRPYVYEKQLKFLQKYIQTGSNSANKQREQDQEENEEDSLSDNQVDSQHTKDDVVVEMKMFSSPSSPNMDDYFYEEQQEEIHRLIESELVNEPMSSQQTQRKQISNNNNNRTAIISTTLIDEDEAFFQSIMPTVKRFNDDDKIDFRMELMGLVKKYKNQSKVQQQQQRLQMKCEKNC